MPSPPSPMARPGACPSGSTSVAPACVKPRRQPARAHPVQHGDRRHVERLLQRLAHRHRALEGEIEILRRVAAVARRPVLDQRLGMDEAVLEAEAVDERLQRRAGRAQRLRSCPPGRRGAHRNRPASRHGRAPRRSRCRPPESRARCRGRASAPARARARARALPDFFCMPASMVSRTSLRDGRRGDRPVGGVRRQHRHAGGARSAPARPWRARSRRPALCRSRRSGRARGRAPCAPPSARAIRPAQLGRLRQRHQQRRLAERQPPRLLAEIGERGGADAFDIAAIGREIEIERENLSLLSTRSISTARTIWRSLAGKCARVRGSSSRATCMVSVEPPERMRPLVDDCNAARMSASGSTP